MNLNLNGKKALVTGGSKGIGLAIKKALEKEGVKVFSLSRTEGIDLLELKNEDRLPKANILINNVGGMGNCTYEDSWICMQKNYGIMNILTESFLRSKPKWGRVITISSIFGK